MHVNFLLALFLSIRNVVEVIVVVIVVVSIV